MGDARVPFSSLLRAFGLPATVTRPAPDDAPISTSIIWLSPLAEDQPYGVDFSRRDPRKVLAVPRSAVVSMPRGTQISAAETPGSEVRSWRVDELLRPADVDHWRVAVTPA